MVNLCAHYNEKLLARDLPSNLKNKDKRMNFNMFFFLLN